jgi:hypothetical protein
LKDVEKAEKAEAKAAKAEHHSHAVSLIGGATVATRSPVFKGRADWQVHDKAARVEEKAASKLNKLAHGE